VAAPVELRPTIDRAWLERRQAEEPLEHAYALWDLTQAPALVRFFSAVRGGETVGYLLVWLGRPDRPVVHWSAPEDVTGALATAMPRPPFVAVVPASVEPSLRAAYPAAESSGLRLLLRPPSPAPYGGSAVRRLGRGDTPALRAFVARGGAPELAGYADLDPGAEPTWGAFDAGGLVGVARASVRLPGVWVVSGVFVDPASRGRGHGEAIVRAVVSEAAAVGASAGLYAWDPGGPALRLYARLGFREVGRRRWVAVPSATASAVAREGR
jgi:GNAT superfamily N-acetyltransferase